MPSMSKRRRGTMSTFAPFSLHEGVLISVARLLKANIHDEEALLEFMWFLLSKAENVSDVDGTVSKPVIVIVADAAGTQRRRKSLPCVNFLQGNLSSTLIV